MTQEEFDEARAKTLRERVQCFKDPRVGINLDELTELVLLLMDGFMPESFFVAYNRTRLKNLLQGVAKAWGPQSRARDRPHELVGALRPTRIRAVSLGNHRAEYPGVVPRLPRCRKGIHVALGGQGTIRLDAMRPPRTRKQLGRLSKNKGKSYERAIAEVLRVIWPEAKRGIGQARAANEVPDVDGTPYWVECKHHKSSPNVHKAYAQGLAARRDRSPVLVVSRHSGVSTDLVTMNMQQFLLLMDELLELRKT
jgi:hypothetical protein